MSMNQNGSPSTWQTRMRDMHISWGCVMFAVFAVAVTQAPLNSLVVIITGLGLLPAFVGGALWRFSEYVYAQRMLLAFWGMLAVAMASITGGLQSPYLLWVAGGVISACFIPRTSALFEAVIISLLAVLMITTVSILQPQIASVPGLMAPITIGFGTFGFILFAALGLLSRRILKASEDEVERLMHDVDVQKRANATLLAERDHAIEASATKTRFLASMSHELRTPLNSIIGFSDVMQQKMFGPLHVKYAEYAELIHDSGRHLLDLVTDILDTAKIEADKYTLTPEVFDLRMAIDDCLKLTRKSAEEAKLQLTCDIPYRDIPVRADRRAIKQMVLNLISNAIKFTPEGGYVQISAETRQDMVHLMVIDTGIGIAENDIKRLGQPFEQAGQAKDKAKGTGLGLSLVRALAELHDGEMIIKSIEGHGTIVTLVMPIVTVAIPEKPGAENESPARNMIKNIRLVTDEGSTTPRE